MPRFADFVPEGVIPAALLAFDEDFAIDGAASRAHLAQLAGVRGISAVTVNAHASEVHACSFDEQRRILEMAMDEIGDTVPLINGVYADGSLEAARIARMAADAGASCLLVFPPHTIGMMGGQTRPEMALAHFRIIAGASDLPIIAFQYPGEYAYPMDTLLRLVDEVPSIRAIKDWNPGQVHERHIRVLQALPRPVNVLSTNSAWLMASLAMGCNGLLSGAGSVIADLQVALFEAMRAKDLARAQRINDRIYPLAQCFYGAPFGDMHNRMKEALVILGRMDRAVVRPPLVKLDAGEIAAIAEALAEAGITRDGGALDAAWAGHHTGGGIAAGGMGPAISLSDPAAVSSWPVRKMRFRVSLVSPPRHPDCGFMTAKIIVDGLYKIFGENPERALDLLKEGHGKDEILSQTGLTVGVQDTSFEITEGEIFVLMGLSGSGKSTLIRMFNRLIEPTAGSVRVSDQDVTAMSEARLIEMRRHEMSMVFQGFALLPTRTVYENASFGLEVAGVADGLRRETTMAALDSVGLTAYADSLPRELSGGMQQRVGLARALATDPEILLMDEAFSALDPLIRAEMQDQLLDLQKERARTVVFVSHDLDEALKIGDRIAIMEHGRVVQVAPPPDILRNPANDYVRAFFRGVDVSHVFTVGEIARRDGGVEIKGRKTGAREALDRLKTSGGDLAVVLDGDSRLAGTVTVASLKTAIERDAAARCDEAFDSTFGPVSENTLLSAAIEPLAASAGALPVVNEDEAYVGLINASDMLYALDREGARTERSAEPVAPGNA